MLAYLMPWGKYFRRLCTHTWGVGALVSLFFFVVLFGTALLDPYYIEWLLEPNNQDAIQHFVGWEFFRYEPWHMPFGQVHNYGYPDVSSIVYTDSIPLFALFFKCFSSVLPEQFQYFGLWYVVCFMLQGAMAWAICGVLSQNCALLNRTLVTLFFLLSPIMIDRMAAHHALTAHGLILASFYLYMRPYRRSVDYFWLILNVIALLTHAYLALMVLGSWLAYLAKQFWIEKNHDLTSTIRCLLINGAVLLLFAWCSGYFVLSFSAVKDLGSYPYFSMNILAPFLPTQGNMVVPGRWSQFIDTFHPPRWGQAIEGFNYLGIGMLCLLILALIKWVNAPGSKQVTWAYLPLVFSTACMALFALSNQIHIGSFCLASFSLPSFFLFLSQTFRAAGRFFWPMYYLIMLGSFGVLLRTIPKRSLTIVLMLALSLQYVELSGKLNNLSCFFAYQTRPQELSLWLTSHHIGERYKHVVFLPVVAKPGFQITGFGDYIHYAARHQMTVNQGYFARKDPVLSDQITRKIQQTAYEGQFDKETMYVLLEKPLARFLKTRLTLNAQIVKQNRYTILLP